MSKQLTATGIPAEDVDDIVQSFKDLGSTDVKSTEQPDGTYTIVGTLPD